MTSYVESKKDNFYSILFRQIERGYYAPGVRLPAERELAVIYNVSRTTVRQALEVLESEGILNRNVGKGTFVNEDVFMALDALSRKSVKATAAFVLPHAHYYNPIIRQTFSYFCEMLNEEIRPRIYFVDIPGAQLEALEGADYIIMNFSYDSYVYDDLKNLLGRMIVVGEKGPHNMNYVMTDHFEGGYMMGRHLLENGHRKVGVFSFLSSDAESEMSGREKGFVSAFDEAGLKIESMHRIGVRYDLANIRLALDNMLKRHPEITALGCLTDFSASCSYSALMEKEMAVPEQMSLIGFDDQLYDRYFHTPMTTVRQPLSRIGEELADAVNRAHFDGKLDVHSKIAPVLVKRLSVKNIKSGQA